MLSESATGVMKVYTAQGNTSRPITENKDITPLPTVLLKIEILSFQYADFITTGIHFFFFFAMMYSLNLPCYFCVW